MWTDKETLNERTKLAFGYASEFAKNLVAVSAGSLTFILTFHEKIVICHEQKNILLQFAFVSAIILLVFSTFFALCCMREIVKEMNGKKKNTDSFADKYKSLPLPNLMDDVSKFAGRSGTCLILAFFLLMVYVFFGSIL